MTSCRKCVKHGRVWFCTAPKKFARGLAAHGPDEWATADATDALSGFPSNSMFTHGALVVAIAANAPLAAAYLSNSVSYKLEIHKQSSGGFATCTFLSLVDSQLHKGLRNSVLVEELPLPLAHLGKDSNGINTSALDYWKIYSHPIASALGAS